MTGVSSIAVSKSRNASVTPFWTSEDITNFSGLPEVGVLRYSAIGLLIPALQNDRVSFLRTDRILPHSDSNIQMLYVTFLELHKR